MATKKPSTRKAPKVDVYSTLRPATLAAAEKQGIDLTGVRCEWGNLEQTWGDLVGVVICGVGVDLALCERAAQWAIQYLRHHLTHRSYDQQTNVEYRGAYTYIEIAHESHTWKGLYRGHTEAKPDYTTHLHGIAVSTCYYPCAD